MKTSVAGIWIVFAALLVSIPCLGQLADYPPEAAFMTHWGTIHHDPPESWGVATIPRYGDHQVQRYGHRWWLTVDIPGFGGNRPGLWASVKPYALKAGWTVVSENPNGGMLIVLHYSQNGVDAWANAGTDNPANRFEMEIIEVVPPPISLTLKEPASIPEKVDPRKEDFPYLAPLPGSEKKGGGESEMPFRLTPKGAKQEEIVANGSMDRGYALQGLSKVLFARVYHDGLLKAGWSIEQETANSEVIVAHYSKNGRNIWAYLLCHGAEYIFRVGKEAAPDLMKTSLATQCHVAVYGVLFDFNKATLQSASDGPLGQVAALMAADPSLKIEVQGHTDNVGGDDYNQKLSEARANSVMNWLTQHGVAAGRITAKGYGKTKPVVDNNTDEGRMKNRRVEIADPRCTPQGK
jgi:outer membrane protein OmpA-like peptidoglycan-associated protein